MMRPPASRSWLAAVDRTASSVGVAAVQADQGALEHHAADVAQVAHGDGRTRPRVSAVQAGGAGRCVCGRSAQGQARTRCGRQETGAVCSAEPR